MYLRIFTPEGRVLSEVPDATASPRITDTGALVVPLPDGVRYVVAPGSYTEVLEYPERPPTNETLPEWLTHSLSARAMQHALRTVPPPSTVPVVPGPAPADDPPVARGGFGGDWPMVVREAPTTGPLSVVCICDSLRCPTVLNPSGGNERAFWRKRQRPGAATGSGAPSPEPLMRCSFPKGHGGDCRWVPGDGDTPPGWPYGPTRHHDECPRNPSNQQPEGHPGGRHVAPSTGGITDADEITDAALARISEALRDAPQDPAMMSVGIAPISLAETGVVDRGALVRPYVHRPSASGDRGTHNRDAGQGICGRWAPVWDHDPAQPDRYCGLVHGHPGQHESIGGQEPARWGEGLQGT